MQLIIGKYYYFEWMTSTGRRSAITRWDEDYKRSCIMITAKKFVINSDNLSATFNKPDDVIREATEKEIQWLLECEEAGHYVPRNTLYEFLIFN